MEALVCGELVVSPIAADSVWFSQTPLIAESGAACKTYVHTMTDVAKTSKDGSLKVITTSDADVCAMWNKEIVCLNCHRHI